MQKELNAELFGEGLLGRTRVIEGAPTASHQVVEVLEKKVIELREQMSLVVDHIGKITQQTNESFRQQASKIERINQLLVKLEQNDQILNMEAAQKIHAMQAKIGERKTMDLKLQEMIDRHNSVLKSYEVRLNQLQKLISEKDAQLLSAQASLNEAKMEIARLKRL